MDRTDSILGADDLVTGTVRGLFPRVTTRDTRTQGLVDELDRWHTAMAAVEPAPWRTRLKISRPNLSVPMRYCKEGGSNLGPTAMAWGS